MNLKRRFASNLGANAYAQAVNVIVQFVSVPLFLKYWDTAVYGEWLLLSSIPAYVAFAEAGFSSVAANEVSILVARGDFVSMRRTLDSLVGLLLTVSGVVAAVVGCAAWLIPWRQFFRFDVIGSSSIAWVLAWLGLYTAVGLVGMFFNAAYRAVNRYPRVTMIGASLRLLELGVSGVVLGVGLGPEAMAKSWCLARVVGVFFMLFDSSRIDSACRPSLAKCRFSEVRRLLKPSIGFMGFTIGNATYFQGTSLAVGLALGPPAVVVFNTLRTLSRVICQAVAMLKQSAWPEFSTLFGSGDLTAARALNRNIFAVSVWLTICSAFAIWLIGDRLLIVWTNGAIQASSFMLLMFLAPAVVNGLWYVCSGVLMGVNHHGGLAIWYVIASAVAVALTYVLSSVFGIMASSVGMLVAELILFPYAIRACCAVLHDRVQPLVLHVFTFGTQRS